MADSKLGLLKLADVARQLRASLSAVDVWSRTGCRVAGHVVKLEFVWVGSQRRYRPEDVERFVTDCTDAHRVGISSCAPPRIVPADVEEARAECERALGRRKK